MNETLKNYVCEICGGELKEIEAGHFQCPYCRAEFFKETKLPDELVLDLHSAGRARSLQRFEDALNEYDRIIASYGDCFDAYWGATLSDYGIQYEKDYDGRMIPTVHRFSETPVFENSYYVSAVKYCKDERELERIKASAEEIERIRSEIKKTVGIQEPYDIFLCYKETSVNNPRDYTPEFYWAVDLYGKLMGLGYRVFFAKQSLPAARGDYEAHIFPALSSAKLMLILTTDVAHVESVWVKNEWSRFIRFSKENPSAGKRFKVIMRGFKPEQLPRELRKEQALNQDSLDWVNQLYAVIADTFRDKKKEEEERRKREADEQAAYFAKMLEEERRKWAAEEQRKQEEERERQKVEEQKRREDEARKRAEEAERKAREDERIRELERKLSEERERNASSVTKTSPAANVTPSVSSQNPTVSTATAPLNTASPSANTVATPVNTEAVDDGKHVYFGSYPQDKVTDENLIKELNGLAGKLPVKTNSYAWTAYKYAWDRSGGTPKLMWYIDVTHGGEKYRGVYFIAYRALESNPQVHNGYSINNVYWFKFRPISWRVLEEKSGKRLLLSERVLDSQPFYHSNAMRRSGNGTVYANSYEKSDVRSWLNSAFTDTAFDGAENERLILSTVSCAASTTMNTPNKFAGGSVKDKVFLLSHKDTVNADYGFLSDNLAKDISRKKGVTDYALCQGTRSVSGYGRWWLRSPNATIDERALYVDVNGLSGSAESVEDITYGIAPAIWVSENVSSEKKTDGAEEGKKTSVKPVKSLEGGADKPQKKAEDPNEPKIGDVIKLGKYRQSDKTTVERVIDWQILDKKDGKALVISKFALDGKKFHEKFEAATWETCTLRKWLNGDFINAAFSETELAAIPTVTVAAHKNPSYDSNSGKPTEDKVFLLSVKEANTYFKTHKAASCMPTTYAKSKGATDSGECRWWLRTIGEKAGGIAYVDRFVGVDCKGEPNNSTRMAVRPAMWVDLGAIKQDNSENKRATEKTDGLTAQNGAEYIEKALKDGFFKGYAINDVPNGKGIITYKNGGSYEGDFVDGKADGIGTLVTSKGDICEGEWKKNARSGNGKITWSNGNVYEGEWFLSDNDVKGKMTYANGDVYEGRFFRYLPNGTGKMVYANGDVYEGKWQLGEKNGIGKLTLANGKVKEGEFLYDRFRKRIPSATATEKTDVSTAQNGAEYIEKELKVGFYKGYAVNDVPSGSGKMTYKNGDVYEGDFSGGKPNGKGKCSFKSGNVYEGDFALGVMHGKGKLTDVSGFTYEGDFDRGIINGKGKMIHKDGTVEEGAFLGGSFKGNSATSSASEPTSASFKQDNGYVEKQLENGFYKGYTVNGLPHGIGTMKYTNGTVYEGCWAEGKQHGKGKNTYTNGNVYDGDHEYGALTGKGKYSYANGEVYEGEFENDKYSGHGKLFIKNGNSYEGQWKNGEKNGKGKITYKDGSSYDGDWVKDLKEGRGKYVCTNGNVYEGDWVSGARHGKGKLTFKDGTLYEGDFVKNERTGKGKITFTSGEIYEGEWKNNTRHGQGKMTFENGEVYEGQWTDDRRTGKGKMTYNAYDGVYEGEWFKDVWSGMGKFSSRAGVYEGMFQNGTYSGNGKMTYSDGTVYEGNWVNGKKEGVGKETNRLSNTTYEGEWKNGFRDGKGKLTFYNGSFYEGEWEQNSFKGKGKMTYKNGKVEKGRFVNGVFKKTLF